MFLTPWIRRFQNRLSRPSHSRRVGVSETLENRTVLTVAGVLRGTELSLFIDEGDDVTVQNDVTTGEVQVLTNGATDRTIPAVLSSALTSLSIFASDDANVIDVSPITAANFTALAASGSIVIQAGDGDDMIFGSVDFGEHIMGGDGSDTIDGMDGADTIDGGDGDDQIAGGIGMDLIDGGDGNDSIDGGDDDDIILGGDGNDTVNAGLGADDIDSGQGDDVVDGGDGNDIINGMSGNDSIVAGLGDDQVLGGSGNDTISGDAGDDLIDGQGGEDLITGGDGNDRLTGGGSNDTVSGGAGDDFLNGSGGNDSLNGEAGDDILFGGGQNDVLIGDAGADSMLGNGGDDTLLGGVGQDTMRGGNGDDFISGGVASVSIVTNVTVPAEGDMGNQTVDFTVSLTGLSGGTVTVDFATADGTALAGSDYVTTTGTLVYPPGVTTQTISVDVIGDTVLEPDETFFVNLTNPAGTIINNATATALIINDDVAPPPGNVHALCL